jgi:hypothetical protein
MNPVVCLNEKGLKKLDDARNSGTGELPEWLTREILSHHGHPNNRPANNDAVGKLIPPQPGGKPPGFSAMAFADSTIHCRVKFHQ